MNLKPDRDLFPGALEMMVLQTVSRSPMHGYALTQAIKLASNEMLQVEEGSLYPALQRMLKAGWLTSAWGLSSRNRRVRVYTITKAGCQQLKREVTSFERMLDGISRVMRTVEA